MIERHGSDNGNIRFVGVDRIEAPAQADFENRRLDTGRGKDFPGGQRAELEIGQRDIAGLLTRRFNSREGSAQRDIINRLAIQANPLVVIEQVRRGVAADLVAGAVDDVFQIGAGRALAIGATHDDDRTMLRLAERILDQANAVEAQHDAGLPLGMQAFKMGQPVVFSHL